MKQHYSIELVEEHEAVNFYSIHLEGNARTELEDFFVQFPIGCKYDDEIDVIIAWMDRIAEKGALERYFRPEGHYGDGVGVIPIDVGNKIRLYCLRISDKVLIFGNGGIKNTVRWEDDKNLSQHVQLLIDTSRFIRSRLRDNTILLVGKEMIGNLNFDRNEKE